MVAGVGRLVHIRTTFIGDLGGRQWIALSLNPRETIIRKYLYRITNGTITKLMPCFCLNYITGESRWLIFLPRSKSCRRFPQ
jgi:hypothetical protein